MEFLNNFFLNLTNIKFSDWSTFIEQLLLTLGFFVVLFWVVYYAFSKILYKSGLEVENGLHRDHALNFILLWSLVVSISFLVLLWAIILYKNSVFSFEPMTLNFWLGIGPMLIVYIFSITIFFLRYSRVRKQFS